MCRKCFAENEPGRTQRIPAPEQASNTKQKEPPFITSRGNRHFCFSTIYSTYVIENTSGQTKGRMVPLQIPHKEAPEWRWEDPTRGRSSAEQSAPAARQLNGLGERQLSCHTQLFAGEKAHQLTHWSISSAPADLLSSGICLATLARGISAPFAWPQPVGSVYHICRFIMAGLRCKMI